MKEPLISVIVPVYNVEKYLNRCVENLLNQTYTNIEIILVDDGSKDNSGYLCDKMLVTDSRIRVIHKDNGGISSARNVGMKAAMGDYITFIDGDDWLELDTYQYCIDLILSNDADSIEFDTKFVFSEEPFKQDKELINVYEGKEILRYYLLSSTRTGSYSVCRCLFTKDAIRDVFFREGKINEDIDFKYKALSKCNKMIVTNQYKYHYFQSGNSLSTGGLKKKDFDLYEACDELIYLTKNEDYKDIKRLAEVKSARTAFSLLSKIAYYGISDPTINKKELIKKLKYENRKNARVLLTSPIPLSRKVLVIMFSISYKTTEFFIRIMKKIWRTR